MTSSVEKCPSCGFTDFDEDDYEKVCTSCGLIVSSNFLVSDVQFSQGSNGRVSLIGQNVGEDMINQRVQGIYNPSTDVARIKVKGLIQRASNVMEPRLTESQRSMALQYFTMAKRKRLVYHRQHVLAAGACIYIVCRDERIPDVSEALNADVFQLGRMFMHIAHGLCLNSNGSLGVADPCLYVERFANKLQFGDRTREVCHTALKLVKGMQKDWIDSGRKPSGLCGAALLVAARKHDFHRTMEQMIRVVRVCKKTIRKRLMEFENTPAGGLTIDEFDTVDVDQLPGQLPPAFVAARDREVDQPDEETVAEIKNMQREIDESTAPKGGSNGNCAKMVGEGTSTSVSKAMDFINDEIMRDVLPKSLLPTPNPSSSAASENGESNNSNSNNNSSTEPEQPQADVMDKNNTSGVAFCEGVADSIIAEEEMEVGEGELDLRGLDDKELDTMILTDEEVRVKTQEWEKEYQQFVEEQEEKRKRQEEERAAKSKGKSKLRQPRVRSPQRGEAASAAEAVWSVIRRKKLTKYFDNDKIQSLFTRPSALSQNGDEQPHGSQQSGSSSQSPVQSSASKRKASDALEGAHGSSPEKKKKQSNGSAEESEEMDEAASSNVQADPTLMEVVDETGLPIIYAEEEKEKEDECDSDFDFAEDERRKTSSFHEYEAEEDDGDFSDF